MLEFGGLTWEEWVAVLVIATTLVLLLIAAK